MPWEQRQLAVAESREESVPVAAPVRRSGSAASTQVVARERGAVVPRGSVCCARNVAVDAAWASEGSVSEPQQSFSSGRQAKSAAGDASSKLKQRAKPQASAWQGLRVLVIGDSGLQLNKSKGISSFESELNQLLGSKVQVIRFPGGGAGAITNYLIRNQVSVDVVVAVWLLNEFFDDKGLMLSYPISTDMAAKRLADALKPIPCRIAVVGGEARLWRVNPRFDSWANRIRQILQDRGIEIVDGVDLYSSLSMTKDGWHAASNWENKFQMARYFADLVRRIAPGAPVR